MKFISVGYHNYIPLDRIVMIMDFNSPACRRLREVYRERYGEGVYEYILDFTRGRKSQAAVLLTTGHLVLSVRSRKFLFNSASTEIEVDDAEPKTP